MGYHKSDMDMVWAFQKEYRTKNTHVDVKNWLAGRAGKANIYQK